MTHMSGAGSVGKPSVWWYVTPQMMALHALSDIILNACEPHVTVCYMIVCFRSY